MTQSGEVVCGESRMQTSTATWRENIVNTINNLVNCTSSSVAKIYKKWNGSFFFIFKIHLFSSLKQFGVLCHLRTLGKMFLLKSILLALLLAQQKNFGNLQTFITNSTLNV